MRVVSVDADDPAAAVIEDAVAVLAAGGVVALPTETFYGLAVDATDREALRRINRLKGKASDAPILLLAADRSQAERLANRTPGSFEALVSRFWPGPLSVVLPAHPDVPREVTGGRAGVAVRVPGLALPRLLAAHLGRAISAPSANRHREAPPRTAEAVGRAFAGELELILDGGPTPGGAPSTLIDLTCEPPRLLRVGQLDAASLRQVLPDLSL